MANPAQTRLPKGNRPASPREATDSARPFVRAATVLEQASSADEATEQALRQPHVALDAFGRILGISEPLAEALGFPRSRLIGRRFQHRVLGIDRARFQAMLVPLRSAHVPPPATLRLRSKDERVLDALLAPLAVTRSANATVMVVRIGFGPSTVGSAKAESVSRGSGVPDSLGQS